MKTTSFAEARTFWSAAICGGRVRRAMKSAKTVKTITAVTTPTAIPAIVGEIAAGSSSTCSKAVLGTVRTAAIIEVPSSSVPAIHTARGDLSSLFRPNLLPCEAGPRRVVLEKSVVLAHEVREQVIDAGVRLAD